MKRKLIFFTIFLIAVISITAYMYARKKPIETVPARATFVRVLIENKGNEVTYHGQS